MSAPHDGAVGDARKARAEGRRDLRDVLRDKAREGRAMSPEDRFWSKVEQSDECWVWQGNQFHDGYGQFYVNRARESVRAHRYAYEITIGPIPDGLVVDHLCRNRLCCNPGHLEPVTNRENVLRGIGFSAVNAVKTHCVNGHEFNVDNTRITPQGHRECRACHRERERARNHATFVCPLCGRRRNRSQRNRHMRAMHQEVPA